MPDKLTITEALAEIKTLNARITKKRQSIASYICRDSRIVDPMAADGGVASWVAKERQSLADLEERVVALRTAIQAVNLGTTLKVSGKERSVAAWLNWRRDVSDGKRGHIAGLINTIAGFRKQVVNATGPDGKAGELVVHTSEKDLAAEAEQMEQTLGDLDGKLSLLNATTTVEV